MTIVAAIDDIEGTDRIVSEAWALAERFDEPLHVVFVYRKSEHSHLANQYMNISKSISEEQATELAERVVADAVEGITDEYEAVGRVGDPADEIVAYAAEVDARYVVVGGRPRSPVGKAVFGSVSQSVLLEADCPVLSVQSG